MNQYCYQSIYIYFFALVSVTFTEVQNTVNTLIHLCCQSLLTDDVGRVAVVALAAVDRGEGGGATKVGRESVEAAGCAESIRGATFEFELIQSAGGIGWEVEEQRIIKHTHPHTHTQWH